jgi:hypothetical protein
MDTSTSTNEESTTTSAGGTNSGSSMSTNNKATKQVFRKSPQQASAECLEVYTVKKEYHQRYKAGFKVSTALISAAVARNIPSEPVQGICNRLNAEYGIAYNCTKHQKQLMWSTIYQAVKDGLAGMSPKKRVPRLVMAS